MNIKEFSDGFSTLLNSFGVQPNITLDEYEKSVFLTNAQEQMIIDVYSGKNRYGDSFEKTEEVRRYLDELIRTSEPLKTVGEGLSQYSVFYKIPDDVWFITYESAVLNDTRLTCKSDMVSVVPITQDEFYRTKDNPFRGPSKDRVLRLDNAGNIKELVSKYSIGKYLIRYIVKPKPIVLEDLSDGLNINGISTESECELNPVVHRAILERAVQLAIISKTQLAGNKE